ncbi:MAG: hypothetical protein ACOX0E_06610 [Syntrophomonadaceae bacterium]
MDAIGKTILDVGCRLSQTDENKKPAKVIFVITTDGLENSSREFTYERIKELIKHQEEEHGWEFIFMGANMDAVKEAAGIGISMENSFNYSATKSGVEEMYNFVSCLVSEKRSDLGKGEK